MNNKPPNSSDHSDKPLKILHVSENFAPDYGGGAGIYNREICRYLAGRGHEVRVVCTEINDAEPYSVRSSVYENILVERINLPYFHTHDPDGWFLSAADWKKHERKISAFLNGYLDGWTPDIVNYNTTRMLGEECLITLAGRELPVVASLHDAWTICPRLNLLRSPAAEICSGPAPVKCLECLYSHYDGSRAAAFLKMPWRIAKLGYYPAYRLARRKTARAGLSGAIAVSPFMLDAHEPHLGGIVKHIPLGIDLSGLPAEKPARPRSPLRFGFIGGSQPIKGLPDVLAAAAALRAEGLSFELHVWGHDQEKCAAEVKARNLGDRVRLGGTYQPEEIWDVYREIDVALMASTVPESFGRVPLEAAAAGAITIAPRAGGLTGSVRDEANGLLFGFRDAKDLERQMRRVLVEPGLFERLQANLPPVVDTRAALAEVEKFYFQIWHSHKSR